MKTYGSSNCTCTAGPAVWSVDGCTITPEQQDGQTWIRIQGERPSGAAWAQPDTQIDTQPDAPAGAQKAAHSSGAAWRYRVTAERLAALRELLPELAPVSQGSAARSFGLGDRIGLAGPGQLAAVASYSVFPILAQQSMRELTLTGRKWADVLDAATLAVFRTGWRGGYGMDGDHLKTEADILTALAAGCSMITLDCSEQLPGDLQHATPEKLAERYRRLPEDVRRGYEERWLGQTRGTLYFPGRAVPSVFTAAERGFVLTFDEPMLYRTAVLCHDLIEHVVRVTQAGERACLRVIDWELSIDETSTATDPAMHWFAAAELKRRGVRLRSVAPRFIGEFQKGIDYIGDRAAFALDFARHTAVARALGHKVSVHSGSDKFAIFPLVGAISAAGNGGRWHVKTAGTNWLEALRVLARTDAPLFREIYAGAKAGFAETSRYYVVHATPADAPDLADLADDQLEPLLTHDAVRQILHIAYGLMLRPDGHSPRRRILDCLLAEEETYARALTDHIGRHLAELDCP